MHNLLVKMINLEVMVKILYAYITPTFYQKETENLN
jgi:hypothetical protein